MQITTILMIIHATTDELTIQLKVDSNITLLKNNKRTLTLYHQLFAFINNKKSFKCVEGKI